MTRPVPETIKLPDGQWHARIRTPTYQIITRGTTEAKAVAALKREQRAHDREPQW